MAVGVVRDGQVVEAPDVGEDREVDQVFPVGEVGDRVVAVSSSEDEDVDAFSARQPVLARAALKRVVSVSAVKKVVAGAAVESVSPSSPWIMSSPSPP